jgi:hypothetical protein
MPVGVYTGSPLTLGLERIPGGAWDSPLHMGPFYSAHPENARGKRCDVPAWVASWPICWPSGSVACHKLLDRPRRNDYHAAHACQSLSHASHDVSMHGHHTALFVHRDGCNRSLFIPTEVGAVAARDQGRGPPPARHRSRVGADGGASDGHGRGTAGNGLRGYGVPSARSATGRGPWYILSDLRIHRRGITWAGKPARRWSEP